MTATSGTTSTTPLQPSPTGDGPLNKKKRKITNGEADSARSSPALAGLNEDAELQIYVQDTSFAIPQRKKLQLEITRAPSGGIEYLRARNQALKVVEFGVPFSKIRECFPRGAFLRPDAYNLGCC